VRAVLVYYYCNAEFGLKNLRHRRIKVSDASNLNDPFDHRSVRFNRGVRKAVEAAIRDMVHLQGFICFSEVRNSVLMWSHYAERNKGFCLGFEVPRERLKHIEYVPEMPEATIHSNMTMTTEEQRAMLLNVTIKHEGWKYERELRFFTPRSEQYQEDGVWFYPFGPDLRLQQVMVGASSPYSRADIKEALGGMKATLDVFKARAAFTKFEIVRNRDDSLWE
jgi:hypothetical protein